MAYPTVADLRDHLGLVDQQDTAGLTRALAAGRRNVERYTRRRFDLDPTVTVRYFTVVTSGEVEVDDIGDSTGLIVATDDGADETWATTWDASDYALKPRNAAADGRPWDRIEVAKAGARTFPCGEGTVRVTARYGWPAVPDDISQAILLEAARLYNRKDSPYGVTGSPDVGGELRLLSRLDADAEHLVRPYRRLVLV